MLIDVDTTLVVFGAGASIDCFAPAVEAVRNAGYNGLDADQKALQSAANVAARHVLPLTRDLVAAVWEEGGSCGQLLELLRAAQQQVEEAGGVFDFEKTLRTLFDTVGDSMEREFLGLRHALANRMKRADKIGATVDTLYTTFFARLRGSKRQGRRFLYVSLNYDRLAEHALNGRSPFKSFADYVAEEEWSYLQPHGNCVWKILPVGEDLGGWKTAEQRFDKPEEYLAHDPLNPWVPALALPMSGDDAGKTAWPASQHSRLLADLGSVDEAIVIGWRGADGHIVQLVGENLSKRLHKIHYVGYGQNDAAEMSANLSSWVDDSTQAAAVTGGFRAYLDPKSALDDLFPPIFG